MLGFGMAVFSAYILDKLLKIRRRTFFVIEMPDYKIPLFKNVGITVVEKTKAFVFEAGKIILAISIVLWFMASFGPGEQFNDARNIVMTENPTLQDQELEDKVASHKLEHSYIGIVGKTIEPVIRPLGYDLSLIHI